MTNHTPEPWFFEPEDPGSYSRSREEESDPGYPASIYAKLEDEREAWLEIARMSRPGHYTGVHSLDVANDDWQPHGDDDANARRIVAAVNACEGIATEDLEAVGNGCITHRLKEIEQHLDTYHDHTMRLYYLIDEHAWSRRITHRDWDVINRLSNELLNLANALRPGDTK